MMDDSQAQTGTPDIPVGRIQKIGDCCKLRQGFYLFIIYCTLYLTVHSKSINRIDQIKYPLNIDEIIPIIDR